MKTIALACLASILVVGPAFADDSLYQASRVGLASAQLVARLTDADVDTVIAESVVPAAAAASGPNPSQGANLALPVAGASMITAAHASQTSGPLRIDDRVVICPDPSPRAAMKADRR